MGDDGWWLVGGFIVGGVGREGVVSNNDPNGGEKLDTDARASLGIAYQVVARMAATETNVWWQRFNTFLTCSSILVAACGVAANALPPLPAKAFITVLSAIGFLVCAMWLTIGVKVLKWHDHWEGTAREIEKALALNVAAFERSLALKTGTKKLALWLTGVFMLLFLLICFGVWHIEEIGRVFAETCGGS